MQQEEEEKKEVKTEVSPDKPVNENKLKLSIPKPDPSVYDFSDEVEDDDFDSPRDIKSSSPRALGSSPKLANPLFPPKSPRGGLSSPRGSLSSSWGGTGSRSPRSALKSPTRTLSSSSDTWGSPKEEMGSPKSAPRGLAILRGGMFKSGSMAGPRSPPFGSPTSVTSETVSSPGLSSPDSGPPPEGLKLRLAAGKVLRWVGRFHQFFSY